MILLAPMIDGLVDDIATSVKTISHEAQLLQMGESANSSSANMRFHAAALAVDAILGEGMLDKALDLCKLSTKYGQLCSHEIVMFEARLSQRRCWHVKSRGSIFYSCLEDFCSCPHFAMSLESDTPLCKHLLAIKLAQKMGTTFVKIVNDEDYAKNVFGY